MCVLQGIQIHNEVRQYDSTWQQYTKHLTETAVRSCNLFKQDRKIQMHKTELATMEFHHLPLKFCKTGFILSTGSDQPVLSNTQPFSFFRFQL